MNIIPLMILFAFSMINIGIDLARHGNPKEGYYNFFTTLISLIVVWFLILWVAGIINL